MSRLRILPCLVAALVTLSLVQSAEAQLGGLIKKAAKQNIPAAQSAGQPKFDNVILELTPARVAKLIAGKRAGQQLANVPGGLVAFRTQLSTLEERQSKIYETEVEKINAWDEKRRAAENCRDSVLIALKEKKSNWSDPQVMQKMQQLAMAIATAQAKGDTAEARRLAEQVQQLSAPSPSDSADARRGCPVPAPTGLVKQYLDLQTQIESLREQIAKLEQAVRLAEQTASGMDERQLAMACERARMFIQNMRNQQNQAGFTAIEVAALNQAIKDLDPLCP
jgi:DNA repair exonuclease SbcCD ATPase subunit